MAVSLGRRLRRIEIPLKEQRPENWKPDLTDPITKATADEITFKARTKRLEFRINLQTPGQAHRRSRNRIKHKK